MTERTLILARHATTQPGSPDHERDLTESGRVEAIAAGEWLAENIGRVDLALVSSARRAQQTWEAIATAGDVFADTEVWPEQRIYTTGPAGLEQVLRETPEQYQVVALIGHAPTLPALASVLTDPGHPDTDTAAWEGLDSFPPMTLAQLGTDAAWLDVGPETAVLRRVRRPA